MREMERDRLLQAALLFSSVLLICSVTFKVSEYSTCVSTKDFLLKSFLKVSISTCVRECSLRLSCMAIDYSKRFVLCNLFTSDNVAMSKGPCWFVRKIDFIGEIPCDGKCINGERCDEETNECKISVKNVAYQKWAMMSSFLEDSAGDKLIDGDITATSIEYCSSTKEELRPRITIELARNYKVYVIIIYNRQDCCQERLRNLSIKVYSLDTEKKVCVHEPGVLDPIKHVFHLDKPCIGRYFELRILDVEPTTLTICELQLIGYEITD
ncbi:hypothetical protein ACF0H5_015175 [Mactra antiquata]